MVWATARIRLRAAIGNVAPEQRGKGTEIRSQLNEDCAWLTVVNSLTLDRQFAVLVADQCFFDA